jgi:putative phosphoserine phosphatase/1-acylglycerol-3-phosphate O-acyltransferase
MATGIPIVPIVIRNAEVVAERNSSTFSAGKVDVAVFPPIPVDDWTTENLSDRIAEVRQLYLDTLKDWPEDVLPDAPMYARAKKARKPVIKTAPAAKTPAAKTVAKAPAKKAPAKKAATKTAAKTPAKKTAAKANPARATRTTKGRP